MSRLLICLSILLMFGCSKVYECGMYSNPYCSSEYLGYIDHVNFKAYTQDEADRMCLAYEYTFSLPYIGAQTVVEDTTITIYPECCECGNSEPAIFGSDYAN